MLVTQFEKAEQNMPTVNTISIIARGVPGFILRYFILGRLPYRPDRREYNVSRLRWGDARTYVPRTPVKLREFSAVSRLSILLLLCRANFGEGRFGSWPCQNARAC